jgi:exodeoxyribonuclease-3
MNFYNAFLDYVNGLKDKGVKIIICGDVNTAHKEIDLARPKENSSVSGFLPEERAWMDKFIAAGFVDTFRVFNLKPDNYTWWDMFTYARDRNVGWRIDYFFVSENAKENVKDAFILNDVMGSDHCPVGIEIQI